MCEDRRPLRHRGAQPARVIDMAVGVDDERDGLAGYQRPGRSHDRVSPFFALARLDDRDVVAGVDRDGGVSAGDQIDTVPELLIRRCR